MPASTFYPASRCTLNPAQANGPRRNQGRDGRRESPKSKVQSPKSKVPRRRSQEVKEFDVGCSGGFHAPAPSRRPRPSTPPPRPSSSTASPAAARRRFTCKPSPTPWSRARARLCSCRKSRSLRRPSSASRRGSVPARCKRWWRCCTAICPPASGTTSGTRFARAARGLPSAPARPSSRPSNRSASSWWTRNTSIPTSRRRRPATTRATSPSCAARWKAPWSCSARPRPRWKAITTAARANTRCSGCPSGRTTRRCPSCASLICARPCARAKRFPSFHRSSRRRSPGGWSRRSRSSCS